MIFQVGRLNQFPAEQQKREAQRRQRQATGRREISIQCDKGNPAVKTTDATVQTDFVDVMDELRKQVQDLKQVVAELTALKNQLRVSGQTRTLLVALSLACLEMSFVVKGPGAVILLFRLEYKTSVVCHNVYTQKVKIARRDRLHILASNRCETFENLLHIDIAPLRSTLSGILHSKN